MIENEDGTCYKIAFRALTGILKTNRSAPFAKNCGSPTIQKNIAFKNMSLSTKNASSRLQIGS